MSQKIEMIKTGNLIPYSGNSRKHDSNQVSQIAASIKEFGFNNPILIDDENGIIAGHGRLMAAQKLGIDEVPCLKLGHLSDAQRRAYVIADNKLALNADWDDETLKAEIERLLDENFDLNMTGFDEEELDKLLTEDTNDVDSEDEDDINSLIEVIVECENEDQQQLAYNILTEKGFKCRLSTL